MHHTHTKFTHSISHLQISFFFIWSTDQELRDEGPPPNASPQCTQLANKDLLPHRTPYPPHPKRVTAIPGISNKPNKFLHVPLVKMSSQKFTSVQTCRGLSCSSRGRREGGQEGRWGTGEGEPLHRGIRLCKQMSWLPFSSRAVRGRG